MRRVKQEKGSMAAYTAIVLVSMLFILLAIFLTSSSKKRSQLDSGRAIRESYEYDVAQANQIYGELVSKQEETLEPDVKEYTFDYTGKEQTFTAPADGVYKLQVWGAQGGSYDTSIAEGGKGGYSEGEIKLTKGTELYVYVGGQGSHGTSTSSTAHSGGGYNGGGDAGYRGGGGRRCHRY